MTNTLAAEETILLCPDYYAQNGYPYEAWAKLRREEPVHFVTEWNGPPYWAITRRSEIMEVSTQPEIFSSMPRLSMGVGGTDPGEAMIRTIIRMDPPEHARYRKLISKRFTPAHLENIVNEVDTIVQDALDRIATGSGSAEMDFVESVSAPIPIWVVAELLGIPRTDWQPLFDWTNEAVGASDPEYQRGRTEQETRDQAVGALSAYFLQLANARRKEPKNDISTLLIQAEIDEKRLGEFELLSYFVILLTAGNETTRNAISGGMHQLIKNPDQLEILRNEPERLEDFAEETLRFVSPVIHMCRVAKQDYDLAGKKIKAGDTLVLFYPSANRDSNAFRDADKFDICRERNAMHLAFGIGEHFCLGNNIARMELKAVFRNLVRRLNFVELIDEPDRLRMTAVGGIKHLNVRYSLS